MAPYTDVAPSIPVLTKDQEDGETLCTPNDDALPPPPPLEKPKPSARERCWSFYSSNSFVLNVIVVICVARAAPWFGAEHLAPQITASQITTSLVCTPSEPIK